MMAIELSGTSCARPFGLAEASAVAPSMVLGVQLTVDTPARCGIARQRVESVVDIAIDERAMEAEQESLEVD